MLNLLQHAIILALKQELGTVILLRVKIRNGVYFSLDINRQLLE